MNQPYDPRRLFLLQRSFLLLGVVAMLLGGFGVCTSSCSNPDAEALLADAAPAPCASGEPWAWAPCLPSLIPGGGDCPGEKVSRRILDSLGVAVWRYRVLDRWVEAGCVLYELECLDSPGRQPRVDAWTVPVWRHRDPVTGALNRFDRLGYLPGESFVIEGVVDSATGKVWPVWWNLAPELR